MVVDTSALIAIVFREPERETFVGLLSAEAALAMSSVNFYEASVVTAGMKRNPIAATLVDNLIRSLPIQIVPVDEQFSIEARNAYFRFGRGWHSAQLNFADCFSYSLAKLRSEPLLFKGDDFIHTDIVPAWRP
jgi:ribonuclease VapC